MSTKRHDALGWGDLEVLLAVCRTGSLSGAARTLGCTHSTVYRRLAAIEEKAGVRFFERLPTGYTMTEAGELALQSAERIEAEVARLGREVLGLDGQLRGTVRLTAPDGMATHLLPPLLVEFRRQHPLVTIELFSGTAAVDLGRREADLAIRATSAPPDQSLGRRICNFRFAAYASPAWLRTQAGKARTELDVLELDDTLPWLSPAAGYASLEAARERVVFTTSSVSGLLRAAREGLGMAYMSCYRGDLEPGVVRVGDLLPGLELQLWVLTHADLKDTARVRVLMRFLAERLAEQASLFRGECPPPWPDKERDNPWFPAAASGG